MYSSDEIREKYLEFFRLHGHSIVPSAPLVPENDPTTLFTGSGMQPMVPYLLGEPHPLGQRITDSQKSFRTQDIEEVGDNRHTTFFEMLGNWSFGDYYKKEQIRWMWEFLTEELGLDPKRLSFTCYAGNDALGIPRDVEAAALWKELFEGAGVSAEIVEDSETGGLQGGRIFYYGDKKNWWSRAGVPGNMPEGEPGGPDTEMFWDFGEEFGFHTQSVWKDAPCHVNCDCGRFMEIGNNVFMEYRKTANGFERLPAPNVDFGGGLERMMAAVGNEPDIFKGDIFDNIRKMAEYQSGKIYGGDIRYTYAFRVVMDHIRSAAFLIGDGVLPSNTDQGYVLRRLLRRAVRFAGVLGIPAGGLSALANAVVETYRDAYPANVLKAETIVGEIDREEERFRKTLEKGLKEFESRIGSGTLSGRDAFDLFSTYGFPLEMTSELAFEKGITVNEEEFGAEFRKHQELSRTASAGKFKGGLADHGERVTMLHTTTHLMLAGLRKYLGEHIHQAGSNITEERLRFDFTHSEKVPRETLDLVEQYVNEAIVKGCRVVMEQISKTDAKARGVEGSFWEKYPDIVNVYTVQGDDGTMYSQELCGGPHVENTGNISGTFRITKEEASSAGVRRIKAVLE